MAGNRSMNENERGLFTLNGLSGMLVAVVLLLVILGTLTYFAIVTQQEQAQNFYTIDQDINVIKAFDSENSKHYNLVGKE